MRGVSVGPDAGFVDFKQNAVVLGRHNHPIIISLDGLPQCCCKLELRLGHEVLLDFDLRGLGLDVLLFVLAGRQQDWLLLDFALYCILPYLLESYLLSDFADQSV